MIFLTEAVLGCVLFTLMVVPSLLKNPLAWVSDYPPAIQDRARALGLIPEEQNRMPVAALGKKAVFSLLAALGLAVVLVLVNGAETFRQGFLLSYGLWLVLVWYDALGLDCLWFCHSKKVILPGTEDMVQAYHDYGFHIKMSCIGMLLGLPVCLLSGLAVVGLKHLGL